MHNYIRVCLYIFNTKASFCIRVLQNENGANSLKKKLIKPKTLDTEFGPFKL